MFLATGDRFAMSYVVSRTYKCSLSSRYGSKKQLLVTSSSAVYLVANVPTWPDFGLRTQLRQGCAGVQSMCNPSKHGPKIPLRGLFWPQGSYSQLVPGQASCNKPGAEAAAEAWLSLCKSCAPEQLQHANLACQPVNMACPICDACRPHVNTQAGYQVLVSQLTSALECWGRP